MPIKDYSKPVYLVDQLREIPIGAVVTKVEYKEVPGKQDTFVVLDQPDKSDPTNTDITIAVIKSEECVLITLERPLVGAKK